MEGSRMTACDECRLRKIRCDRSSPCSHCRDAGRICLITGAGRRSKENRQGGFPTTQCTQKIDLIEKRLTSIERLLTEGIPLNFSSPYRFQSLNPLQEQLSSHHGQRLPAILDHDTSVMGISSSSLARIQRPTPAALFSDSGALANSEISSANARQHSPEEIAVQSLRADSSCSNAAMPPTIAVVEILRHLKERSTINFSILPSFMPKQSFIERCRNVVFCIEDYSQVDLIIVNSGLYQLFQEKSCMTGDVNSRHEYRRYAEMCKRILENALASMSAFLPACIDSVQALLLGTTHAIEVAKPGLAWRLVGLAAQLCFTMGYNDAALAGTCDNELQLTKLLFWCVYAIEKGLSLRLGRASTIRDCDVTIGTDFEIHSLSYPWPQLMSFWVAMAKIQSNVYELLCSPRAVAGASSESMAHAEHLLGELRSSGMLTPHVFNPRVVEYRVELADYLPFFDKFTYFATATIICRAKSIYGSTAVISQECLLNARAALDAHAACMQITNDNGYARSKYIHWKLLSVPLVPFTIIFYSFLNSGDISELSLLEAFLRSIESSTNLSPALHRVRLLCQGLFDVAKAFGDSATRVPRDEAITILASEMDGYMKKYGFPNNNDYNLRIDIKNLGLFLPQLENWIFRA